MPKEGLLRRCQQRNALFVQGRKIPANPTEHGNTRFGAEAARHLLLDFDHPQSTFRLIVVKGDSEVEEEAQHISRA